MSTFPVGSVAKVGYLQQAAFVIAELAQGFHCITGCHSRAAGISNTSLSRASKPGAGQQLAAAAMVSIVSCMHCSMLMQITAVHCNAQCREATAVCVQETAKHLAVQQWGSSAASQGCHCHSHGIHRQSTAHAGQVRAHQRGEEMLWAYTISPAVKSNSRTVDSPLTRVV